LWQVRKGYNVALQENILVWAGTKPVWLIALPFSCNLDASCHSPAPQKAPAKGTPAARRGHSLCRYGRTCSVLGGYTLDPSGAKRFEAAWQLTVTDLANPTAAGSAARPRKSWAGIHAELDYSDAQSTESLARLSFSCCLPVRYGLFRNAEDYQGERGAEGGLGWEGG